VILCLFQFSGTLKVRTVSPPLCLYCKYIQLFAERRIINSIRTGMVLPIGVKIARNSIVCKKSIKSVGIMLDPELSFGGRVDSIVSSCNYHIRTLQHIRTTLLDEIAMTVGRATDITTIDYWACDCHHNN